MSNIYTKRVNVVTIPNIYFNGMMGLIQKTMAAFRRNELNVLCPICFRADFSSGTGYMDVKTGKFSKGLITVFQINERQKE